MARIRRDVAKLGDGWNDTLLWYAKAVRELDTRAIDDRTSWRFLGAMHGFNETAWRASDLFRPGEATPADLTNNTFGDQCQHGTWYFLPWHRGYLAAFEAIVAAAVKKLQGPDDWALPYWNYFDAQNPNARRIPAPFLDPVLPDDGKPNPLSQPPRRDTTVLEPFGSVPDISLMAMNEPDFLVGGDGTIGFGGGVTSFSRSGARAGDLERNPHNPVHVMIGGFDGGFMSDPNFAGLDPLFWLHHCNIDRLWEAWMNAPGRTMVRDPRWLQGPVPRRFVMPDPAGVARTFIPRDTLKGGSLAPDLRRPVERHGAGRSATRPRGCSHGHGIRRQQSVDVLGASHDSVRVGAEPVTAAVPLESRAGRGLGPRDGSHCGRTGCQSALPAAREHHRHRALGGARRLRQCAGTGSAAKIERPIAPTRCTCSDSTRPPIKTARMRALVWAFPSTSPIWRSDSATRAGSIPSASRCHSSLLAEAQTRGR